MTVGPHGQRSSRTFFSIADELHGAPASSDEDLSRAIDDCVRAHLVADVEVGAFLSAGLDSGAIVGLASEVGTVSAVTLVSKRFWAAKG